MWDYINPKWYFRYAGWYLSFHDRFKLEPRSWREKHSPDATYVRNMRDAGRGHLL